MRIIRNLKAGDYVDCNFEKQINENDNQYLWRLGMAKQNGTFQGTWDDLANLLNKTFFQDEVDYLSSSAYRKRFQAAKQMYDDVFVSMQPSTYQNDLNNQLRALEEAKTYYRDERTAWNQQNRGAARLQHNLDDLGQRLVNIGKIQFNNNSKIQINSDNDLIVCASDWHIGETFSNEFGQYNSDIAKDRIVYLLNEILRIGALHHSENIYLMILGDNISGNIHLSIQVSNRENINEQIKLSAQLFTNLIVQLAQHFSHVYVVGVDGNHTRLVANKDLDIKDERLDNLIVWIIKQMTSHIDNVTVIDKNRDNGIAEITVRGKKYVGVHGYHDAMSQNSIGKLCMMLGYMPTAILGGHKHTPAYQEFNGVKYIQSGSLAGSGDSFTLSKRLYGRPSQTILVCDNIGIDAIYNVDFMNE